MSRALGLAVAESRTRRALPQSPVALPATPYCSAMAHRMAKVVGTSLGALGLVGAGLAYSANGEDSLNPAAEVVADLPVVSDFSIRGTGGDCRFDADRGGLVLEDLTIGSRSTGRLELSFYVQRDSLDDILPGYVTTLLTFDDDSRSHTFDVVVPVSKDDYEAGYDECLYTTNGE